jgi:hypothetical protein
MTMSYEGHSHIRMEMPLSAVDIAYQAILYVTTDPDPPSSRMEEVDIFLDPIWVINSYIPYGCLDNTFPSYEAILEAMIGHDKPWEELHHRSYFLLELERIERDDFRSTMRKIFGHTVVLLDKNDIYVQGNMENISPTIAINISQTPGKVENFISMQIVRLKKLRFTPTYLRNSKTYFLGHMNKCQGSTLVLSNTKSRLV